MCETRILSGVVDYVHRSIAFQPRDGWPAHKHFVRFS